MLREVFIGREGAGGDTRLRTFCGVAALCGALNSGFVRRQVGICTLNLGLYGAVVAYVRTVKTASRATAMQMPRDCRPSNAARLAEEIDSSAAM